MGQGAEGRHATDPKSPLRTISTEFIPWPDYGGGAKYSIFENSVACAQWIRDEWAKAQREAKVVETA